MLFEDEQHVTFFYILFPIINLRLNFIEFTRSISNSEAIGEYIQIMSDSDLTICPTTEHGNPETHCIYEAFSLGSVPVVEDVTGCKSLNLLEEYKAPMLLVKSIEHGLGQVIALEKKMNLQEKIARRATITNWYADFRHRIAREFVRVIRSHVVKNI